VCVWCVLCMCMPLRGGRPRFIAFVASRDCVYVCVCVCVVCVCVVCVVYVLALAGWAATFHCVCS